MRTKRYATTVLLIILFFTAGQSAHAQKAKHKLANQYFEMFDFKMAANIYKDILSNPRSAKDTLALRRLAECEMYMGHWVNAEGYYKRLAEAGAAREKDLIKHAEALKYQGRYDSALEIYQKVLTINPTNDIAKRYVDNPEFAFRTMRDSMIYTLSNSSINSAGSDFATAFFTANKMVYSSSKGNNTQNQRLYNYNQQPYLNLYLCEIGADSSLKNAIDLAKEINTRYHDGTVTYDPGQNKIYVTRNNVLNGNLDKSKDQKLKLGIYTATYTGNSVERTFDNLQAFPFNNKEYNVGNPALNGSRTRLYFVSDKPGGFGGTDIYYCDRSGETWSNPVNAGPKINTSGNEMFPFLVGDSTLYFSSNGHLSLGGLDVFYTNPYDDVPVRNAGYPANSRFDDFAMICFPEETVGYFSSNRTGGKGDDDIYEFKIHPPSHVIVTGLVLDAITLQPIPNAIISVPAEDGSSIQVLSNERGEYNIKVPYKPVVSLEANKQGYLPGQVNVKTDPRSGYLEDVDIKMQKIDYMTTGKVLYDKDSSPAIGALVELFEILNGDTIKLDSIVIGKTGIYMFPLMKNKTYMTLATKPEYSRQSQLILTNDPDNKVLTRDFRLFKLEKGTKVRVDNITYDYNSAVIKPSAFPELDKLVGILKDNPGMRVELSSHSDSRGGDNYNLNLSDRRAKSAVEYIINKGIDPSRIIAKGYGEQFILNHCTNGVECTDAEHEYNRRTEFKII